MKPPANSEGPEVATPGPSETTPANEGSSPVTIPPAASAQTVWHDGGIEIVTATGSVSLDLAAAATVAASTLRRIVEVAPELLRQLTPEQVDTLGYLAGTVLYGAPR